MNDTESCMLFGWQHKKRWEKTSRPYLPKDVLKLRGNLKIEHTVATTNSKRLWRLLNKSQPSQFLEISSVNNAIKEVEKGAQYILLTSSDLVQQVNAKLRQADQVEPNNKWIVPIVVNVEFKSFPDLYENIMQSIKYGAAAIFISAGSHLSAIPARYMMYQPPDIAIPTLRPTYSVITAKMVPRIMPKSTFLQTNLERSKLSTRWPTDSARPSRMRPASPTP